MWQIVAVVIRMKHCLYVLFIVAISCYLGWAKKKHVSKVNPKEIRDHVTELNARSRYVDMLKYLNELEQEHGLNIHDFKWMYNIFSVFRFPNF